MKLDYSIANLILIKPILGYVLAIATFQLGSMNLLVASVGFSLAIIIYEVIRPKLTLKLGGVRNQPVEWPLKEMRGLLTPEFYCNSTRGKTLSGSYRFSGQRWITEFKLFYEGNEIVGQVMCDAPFPYDIFERSKAKVSVERAARSVGYLSA
jgi:hypothetical protein